MQDHISVWEYVMQMQDALEFHKNRKLENKTYQDKIQGLHKRAEIVETTLIISRLHFLKLNLGYPTCGVFSLYSFAPLLCVHMVSEIYFAIPFCFTFSCKLFVSIL